MMQLGEACQPDVGVGRREKEAVICVNFCVCFCFEFTLHFHRKRKVWAGQERQEGRNPTPQSGRSVRSHKTHPSKAVLVTS